jgi:thiosulfate dehydrogenase [quinone] large subunit
MDRWQAIIHLNKRPPSRHPSTYGVSQLMKNTSQPKNEQIAYFLLRVTLGANLFLHGVARLIGNRAAFGAYMDKQMHNSPLPLPLVNIVADVLPWIEGLIGFFIILGLGTMLALVAGSLLLLMLQIGVCLAQNWDIAGAQLIYVLLLFLLITYQDRNWWSVDRLLIARSAKPDRIS